MKKLSIVFLSILLTYSLLLAEERKFSGNISIGTEVNKIDDKATKNNEFNKETDKDFFPKIGVGIKFNNDGIYLGLSGQYNKVDNQKYGLEFDLKRYVVFEGSYDRFFHRLEKDTLSNLWAHAVNINSSGNAVGLTVPSLGANGTIGAATVYNTDITTINNYGLSFRELNDKIEFHIPSLKGVSIGFSNRILERKGYSHTTALSHCSSCHVMGADKRIDEKTTEYTPYVDAKLGNLSVNYSFTKINYNSNASQSYIPDPSGSPTAAPSASLLSLFYNRAQYDYKTGSIPFDADPDSDKTKQTIKVKYDISKDSYLFLSSTMTNSKNTSTNGNYDPINGKFGKDLELEYKSVDLKLHTNLTKKLSMNLKAGYKKYDNDDVFVDVVDRTNPATAPGGAVTLVGGLIANSQVPAGYTYDFIRQSLYNRDEYNLSLDLNYRLNPTITFLFNGDMTKISRDNAEEYEVTEETTKYTAKLQTNIRPSSSLKSKIYYKYTNVDKPFTFFKAGCATDFTRLDSSNNPKYYGPAAGMYMLDALYGQNVYDTRKAGMSIEPAAKHELYADISKNFTPGLTANIFGKIENSKNDDLKTYEWQKKLYKAGVNLSYLAKEKLTFFGGYNFLGEKYDSIICASYYDG